MGRAATTKAPRASARRASTRRSDEASPAKRARGDDAASGGRDDDDGDGDDDGDDDASDDANDANDANDAGRGGPASVAGTREARGDDGDEGEGGTGRAADAAAGERRRAPISIKAPPLLEEQISRLSEVETRKVLGRWNARLRGLKRRVQDISHQFPTSSLVLVFTKPFRSKDKRGKWYVVHRDSVRRAEHLTDDVARSIRSQGGRRVHGERADYVFAHQSPRRRRGRVVVGTATPPTNRG
jgi:hypothetical protein